MTSLWALVGVPNSGKTALFNALTGARQRLGNYAGVTVEKKIGNLPIELGENRQLIDLPGIYSLDQSAADSAVTLAVLRGEQSDCPAPDALLVVVDATEPLLGLRLALELRQLGKPMLLVLNMWDIAQRRGLQMDIAAMAEQMGMPVVPAVAVRRAH